jgi:hypothetical protein
MIPSLLRATALYAGAVFAAGVALGTLRTLLLAPRLGTTTATLLELPVMLGFSWIACGWALDRAPVPAAVGARAALGALAFALLMTGEATLAATIGDGVGAWVAGFGAPAGAAGLAGQLVFAALPLLSRRAR